MSSQPFDKLFDGENVLVLCLFEGTGFSNQMDGHCNGREGFCNDRNFDLKASAKEACPDPCSKISDNNDDVELLTPLKVGINVPGGSIANPFFPIFVLIRGSLSSDPIVNGLPHRQDITRCISFLGGVYSVQQRFCGMGKGILK